MPAKAGEYDKTQCRAKQYAKTTHRDYLAHVFRWGWATRYIHQDDIVVDAGCGQDAPMAHEMVGHMSFRGARKGTSAKRPLYYGVDMNKTITGPNAAWAMYFEGFDFINDYEQLPVVGQADLVTSFEVVEHLGDKDNVVPYLEACRAMLNAEGVLMLSTPAYDGVHQAKNHLYELTIEELGEYLHVAGFDVIQRFGTFASWPALKKVIPDEQRALYESLLEFYSHDVLSCFLAPLYPDHSRNNAWLCKPNR